MANIDRTETHRMGFSILEKVGLFGGDGDPSSSGFEAPIGSLFMSTNGELYKKFGAGDSDWETCCGGGGPSVPYEITSFTNDGGNFENGESPTNINLNWTLPSDPDTQSINQGVGIVNPNTLRTVIFPGPVVGVVNGSFTWQLSVTQGLDNDTANTSINFRNRRYWGVSTDPNIAGVDTATAGIPASGGTPVAFTYNDLVVTAGVTGNELATNRNQTKILDATGGRYLYFAWPSGFGTPSFTINGFPVSAWKGIDSNFTNQHGYVESYSVWRSQNLQNGAAIEVVVT